MSTNDLTQESLLELMNCIRDQRFAVTTTHIVVTQQGLDRMKALCDADPEFRKRVIAEFPQLEYYLNLE